MGRGDLRLVPLVRQVFNALWDCAAVHDKQYKSFPGALGVLEDKTGSAALVRLNGPAIADESSDWGVELDAQQVVRAITAVQALANEVASVSARNPPVRVMVNKGGAVLVTTEGGLWGVLVAPIVARENVEG